jgi:Pentapeptide repeats (8 copies)
MAADPPPNTPDVPDRREPSEKRKVELQAAYHEETDAPYHGVRIQTLGEVEWIFAQRRWSGRFILQEGMKRPNLRGADLSYLNLTGANLYGAALDNVDLSYATMSGANLNRATLNDANLHRANLSGAYLGESELSGANLTRALLASSTDLDGTKFVRPPTLLGVRWDGVSLDAVDWRAIRQLGDEPTRESIKICTTLEERVESYRNAARAYHGLVLALDVQGLVEPARRFRQRERTLERRALRSSPRTWGAYLFYSLLNLISGQGEEPQRIVVAYAIIISVFTAIYWAVSHSFATKVAPALHWYEALVLSLSSFHGRGFFPSQIGLGDPLAIVAAFEAVIGLFIELILIATFSNRFLTKG